MGIRFYCPNGHKLNVKEFQAGRRGICPFCGARTQIPTQSTRPSSREGHRTTGQTAGHHADHDEGDQESDSSPDILPGEPPNLPVDPGGGKLMHSKQAAPLPSVSNVPATPNTAKSNQFPPSGPAVISGPAAPSSPVPHYAAASAPEGEASAPPLPPMDRAGVPAAPAARPEPPDPITDAPDMIWYIRPPTGGQFGPAPGELMRTWMNEGRVSADSLVWREGWRDWQEAGTVFPKLRGTQPTDPLDTAIAPTTATGHPRNGSSAHTQRPKHGRSTDRTQVTLLVLLVLAVIVLSCIHLRAVLR